MASKDVLKHGESYVPTINDNNSSDFEAYETYSRRMIDQKIAAAGAGSGGQVTETGYDWTGKKIVYEGESITMNGTIAYPEYVAEQTGSTPAKIGIAGVPIMGSYVGQAKDFR